MIELIGNFLDYPSIHAEADAAPLPLCFKPRLCIPNASRILIVWNDWKKWWLIPSVKTFYNRYLKCFHCFCLVFARRVTASWESGFAFTKIPFFPLDVCYRYAYMLFTSIREKVRFCFFRHGFERGTVLEHTYWYSMRPRGRTDGRTEDANLGKSLEVTDILT